ncbi:MAG TPA: hypothetical protein VJL31_15180 [Gemmatimonadales bacterium]|jgi:hypothetical protein|nr:hypothetical protein [Gemmatimonadales bacterium]
MRERRGFTVAAGLLTAAVVGSACEQPEATAVPDVGSPLFWVGCPAAKKFTGGGRIDPGGQKVTFGFNIHASNTCEPLKGQLQVVYHPTQSKYHAGTTSSGGSITSFASFPSPEGGECGEFRGTVRAKHGNGEWHTHDFFAQACDNGEPGSSPGTGPDTFWFEVSGEGPGHGSTGRTPLTGGNIQAH